MLDYSFTAYVIRGFFSRPRIYFVVDFLFPPLPSQKSVLEDRRERGCVVRLHRFVVATTKIDMVGVRADSRCPVALTSATMVNEERLLCVQFPLYVCA